LQRTLADLKPRPGDIAAFYDAKLKGKKGLSSYTQNVGSVEEPLVGIVSESETKKHKLRVLQVERGVPEEVSYRCDDLKSGRVVVSLSSRLRALISQLVLIATGIQTRRLRGVHVMLVRY
jgi:hypothetical protein